MLLGSEVYIPIANLYHEKLRSQTKAQQQPDSYPTRQTPRFLGIIATPDDEQKKRQAGERKGDSTEVAVLRWDVVKNYLGSTADLIEMGVGC